MMKRIRYILVCLMLLTSWTGYCTTNDSVEILIHRIYRMHYSSDMNKLLSIYAHQYGAQSQEYADGVLWCAMRVAEYGDIKEAERLLEHSERLFEKYGNGPFDGRDSIEQVMYLDTKTIMERHKGREYLQMKYAEKAVALKKQVFGLESDIYLYGLLDLSELYAERLLNRRSFEAHNSGYETYVNLIKREFARLPESKRQDYWYSISGYIDKTISIAHNAAKRNKFAQPNELAKAAYTALLLSKGLLLNTTLAFENYVRDSEIESAVALLDERKNSMASGASTTVLDSLDYAILDELAAHGKPYRVNNLDITWDSVQNHLNDDDLAVEFYRTTFGEYGVLALRKSWSSPKIIPLQDMVRINSRNVPLDSLLAIGLFTFPFTEPKVQEASKIIWPDELVKYFPKTDTGTVYFSAEGEMLVVPIENVPFPGSEKYTMSDVYHMHRVSSTRELALSKPSPAHKMATLFGDIDYKEPDAPTRAPITKPLPYTKIEAVTITPILQNEQIEVTVYTGDTAKEESVKALSGKEQNILHFATHGFFATNKTYSDDPLNRSGLVFAGVDKAKRAGIKTIQDGVNEGILTSKEISYLDFQSADVVVMSACETGLGEITKDGVFGLQRAFKMAGAQTIVMALWTVEDEATSELMTAFYRNYYEKHQSKWQAFHNAQQEIKAKHPIPYFWAGFILLD